MHHRRLDAIRVPARTSTGVVPAHRVADGSWDRMAHVGDAYVLRSAVRGLVVDELDRVLLLRYDVPELASSVWAAPGGGVEDGEDDRDALRRELAEEVGLRDPVLGPPVWTRTHVFPMAGGYDGQTERYYLLRTPSFEPLPVRSAEQLSAEGITETRWWTAADRQQTDELFAPRRLPALLADLLASGPPGAVLDVGM